MPRKCAFVWRPGASAPASAPKSRKRKTEKEGNRDQKPTRVLSEGSLLPLKSLFALHFGVFLPLHPAVLEPDLDLPLVET